MSRVTIKSIARDLGISHMTVSRALSGNPNVSKETRDAVQKRARDLGYVRSAAALVMRGDGPGIVGLLLPNIVNEFYARFANAMAVACEAESLQLIIHLTNDDIATEAQALDRLREVQASAVVMVPVSGQPDTEPLGSPTMRVIELIRQRDRKVPGPAILVEDAPAIRDALRHLARAGHRWIAYIGANQELSSGRQRLAAVMQGAKEAGIGMDAALIRTGPPSFEMGRDHARDILNNSTASALLCGGVEISNGALSALMDAGAETASKVAFIGYGDPSFYAWVNGGISTIRVPVVRLADCAVAMITCTANGSTTTSFPARLVIR